MAPSGVQPHLEETALVVDKQVLPVSQVLHDICSDGYSERRKGVWSGDEGTINLKDKI